jgi:hypothetical protein
MYLPENIINPLTMTVYEDINISPIFFGGIIYIYKIDLFLYIYYN